MIDLDRVRADTIGVDDIVHLNNCGSALPPRCVVDAQVDYLRAEQRMGGYEAATARADDLHEFYVQTECNVVVGNAAGFMPVRSGSMGRAIPGHRCADLPINES